MRSGLSELQKNQKPVLIQNQQRRDDSRAPRCVIVVENLPVPFDRRVWQEAQALRNGGWVVSVICPMSARHPEAYEEINGIHIYRHPLPLEARGRFAFLAEYGAALFHEARLLLKVARHQGFDVIQGCNPPDLVFLLAAPLKLFGKRFVFDHHDLCPELFEAKFERRGLLHAIMVVTEWLSIQLADLVISANDSYREVAIERGGKSGDDVVTVYSVPDRSLVRRVAPNDELRGEARVVLGYVGILGDQDGGEDLVRCFAHLVRDFGVLDTRFVVVGDGPALASIKALAEELGVAELMTFTGYLLSEELLAALSTFDIGVIPDPYNSYNDKISMNKVFEYSTLGIPIVSYDLTETRRLLGGTGVVSREHTPMGLARACLTLIDDDSLRAEMGHASRQLAEHRFNWDNEAEKYVAAFDRLMTDAVEVQSA